MFSGLKNWISNKINSAKSVSNPSNSVLLIDEVDVFFDEDFYGKIYASGFRIADELVVKFLKAAWASKTDLKNLP